MRIESGSSLGTFLTCPKKYQYAYVERLQSPNYGSALGFGTFVHACIEGLKKEDPSLKGEAYRREVEKYPQEESREQIEHDYTLAMMMVVEWKKYWDAHDGHLGNRAFEFRSTEAEWGYEVASPCSSHRYMLVGKRDGEIYHASFGKNFLHEIKTSGDTDRDTYRHKLQLDRQISTNITALNREGKECDGVIYDILWKPRLIRGVNRKTKPDETFEEFRERIIADVRERPDHYFERVMVQRSEMDKATAQKDLLGQFQMLDFAERVNFPRNQGACENFGRLCPYFTFCMDDIDAKAGFQTREEKFPELSKEFQMKVAGEIQQPGWPASNADMDMADRHGRSE